MSAKKNEDQNLFGEGADLNQDLIDQMLNGGDLAAAAPTPDPWSDDALQAEIDAARAAAGVMDPMASVATMAPPASMPAPTPISAAPSAPANMPTDATRFIPTRAPSPQVKIL